MANETLNVSRPQFHSLVEDFWLREIQPDSGYSGQAKAILQNVIARLEAHIFRHAPLAAASSSPRRGAESQPVPTEPVNFDIDIFCQRSSETIAKIWEQLGQPPLSNDAVNDLTNLLLNFFSAEPSAIPEQPDAIDNLIETTRPSRPRRDGDGGAISQSERLGTGEGSFTTFETR